MYPTSIDGKPSAGGFRMPHQTVRVFRTGFSRSDREFEDALTPCRETSVFRRGEASHQHVTRRRRLDAVDLDHANLYSRFDLDMDARMALARRIWRLVTRVLALPQVGTRARTGTEPSPPIRRPGFGPQFHFRFFPFPLFFDFDPLLARATPITAPPIARGIPITGIAPASPSCGATTPIAPSGSPAAAAPEPAVITTAVSSFIPLIGFFLVCLPNELKSAGPPTPTT